MALSRRTFIYSGLAAGGALVVYSTARMLDTGGDGDARAKFGASTPDDAALNAWVKVAPDGTITYAVHRAEMGQGVTTSLPMLLAEEMDADWERVRYEFSPVDKDYYNFGVMGRARPFGETEGRPLAEFGTNLMRRVFHAQGMSLTLSSTSIIDAWDTLRPAGAAARAVLVAAAAERWGVAADSLQTLAGRVVNPDTGEALDFGELAEAAAALPVPDDPPLKDPANYRLIGRSLPRLDIPAKVDGRAVYGFDVILPEMLFGAVVHSPVAGGRVAGFDAAGADEMSGVEAVVPLGDAAVAVLAQDTWTAFSAARQVRIETADGEALTETPDQRSAYRAIVEGASSEQEPSMFRDDGAVTESFSGREADLDVVYEWPYLAHACMEPMNCTALFREGALDVWVGTQALSVAREVAATAAGIEPARVTMHRTLLGGGFGRRAEMDFVERAVRAAVQVPGRPVKLVYSREEDMRHDMYRPAGALRVRAILGEDSRIEALDLRLATQSVVADFATRTPTPRPSEAASDKTVSTGMYNLEYAIPNMRLAFHPQDPHVPAGYWRSTSTSYGAFCIESLMDELAAAAGRDPLEFRLANLPAESRFTAVLNELADRAEWGRPMPEGRAQGLAVFEKAGSVIGQVAEISIAANGDLSVDRIVCVCDTGAVIHPDTVKAMMEGGIAYGVSAALLGRITLRGGVVEQSNFHDYRELRLGRQPSVEVYLLPSGGRPEGVGETAVPGVAPAIANAIFSVTGKRIRSLPLGMNVA